MIPNLRKVKSKDVFFTNDTEIEDIQLFSHFYSVRLFMFGETILFPWLVCISTFNEANWGNFFQLRNNFSKIHWNWNIYPSFKWFVPIPWYLPIPLSVLYEMEPTSNVPILTNSTNPRSIWSCTHSSRNQKTSSSRSHPQSNSIQQPIFPKLVLLAILPSAIHLHR